MGEEMGPFANNMDSITCSVPPPSGCFAAVAESEDDMVSVVCVVVIGESYFSISSTKNRNSQIQIKQINETNI
jgi:hypothetical protein